MMVVMPTKIQISTAMMPMEMEVYAIQSWLGLQQSTLYLLKSATMFKSTIPYYGSGQSRIASM